MKIPLFVVDFEGDAQTGIIEFGVVEYFEGKVSGVYSEFCKARADDCVINPYIHGIEKESLKDAFDIGYYLPRFQGFRRRGLFVAHNAVVENLLIKQAMPYPGEVPDFLAVGECELMISWGYWIDTLVLYRSFYPGLGSYKLMDLVEVFDLGGKLEVLSERYCARSRRKAHCALYDALACMLLLGHLLTLDVFKEDSLRKLIIYSGRSVAGAKDLNQVDFLVDNLG